MAGAKITTGEGIVFAWIRSDACGVGLKMLLDRKPVDPLVVAIDAALAAVRPDAAALAEARAEAGRLRAERDEAETRTADLLDAKQDAECEALQMRLQRDAAEADAARLRAENDRLRGLLANSNAPCPYCALPADRMAECAHGFPGCGRADDMLADPAAFDGLGDMPDPERAAADDPVPDFDLPTPAPDHGDTAAPLARGATGEDGDGR